MRLQSSIFDCRIPSRTIDRSGVLPTSCNGDRNIEAADCWSSFQFDVRPSEPAERDVRSLRRWQELVAFLEPSEADAYGITNDEPGLAASPESDTPAIAFLVKNGRIQRAPPGFSQYLGMSIDAFVEELSTLFASQVIRDLPLQ
jgi:hypothetical protein